MAEEGRNETVYDAIVIGTGQGGVPLAKRLAEAGKRSFAPSVRPRPIAWSMS